MSYDTHALTHPPISPTCTYSPGMPEMLSPGVALVAVGLGKEVALVTDGRFSGGSHGEDLNNYMNMVQRYTVEPKP